MPLVCTSGGGAVAHTVRSRVGISGGGVVSSKGNPSTFRFLSFISHTALSASIRGHYTINDYTIHARITHNPCTNHLSPVNTSVQLLSCLETGKEEGQVRTRWSRCSHVRPDPQLARDCINESTVSEVYLRPFQ